MSGIIMLDKINDEIERRYNERVAYVVIITYAVMISGLRTVNVYAFLSEHMEFWLVSMNIIFDKPTLCATSFYTSLFFTLH